MLFRVLVKRARENPSAKKHGNFIPSTAHNLTRKKAKANYVGSFQLSSALHAVRNDRKHCRLWEKSFSFRKKNCSGGGGKYSSQTRHTHGWNSKVIDFYFRQKSFQSCPIWRVIKGEGEKPRKSTKTVFCLNISFRHSFALFMNNKKGICLNIKLLKIVTHRIAVSFFSDSPVSQWEGDYFNSKWLMRIPKDSSW